MIQAFLELIATEWVYIEDLWEANVLFGICQPMEVVKLGYSQDLGFGCLGIDILDSCLPEESDLLNEEV
jgi:hypothetical protein